MTGKVIKLINKVILSSILLVSFVCVFSVKDISAQKLSLSISPPITDIMMKPGTEVTQRFILTNNGSDDVVKVYVQPFSALDTFGNVALGKKVPGVDLPLALSWFSIDRPGINLGESFSIKENSSQDILLKIKIGENIPVGDYYFTLIFETSEKPSIGGPGLSSKAIIGSNILLTITNSEFPTKIAKIETFAVPKIIDSFQELPYTIEVSNVGKTRFSPIGELVINPLLGKSKTYKLAPYNIIIDSTRTINCMENDEVVPCIAPGKFHLGIYTATLKFKTDEEGVIYEKTDKTIAFPFTLVVSLLAIFIFYKVFRTNNLGNS